MKAPGSTTYSSGLEVFILIFQMLLHVVYQHQGFNFFFRKAVSVSLSSFTVHNFLWLMDIVFPVLTRG